MIDLIDALPGDSGRVFGFTAAGAFSLKRREEINS
jgi:hypothetical protein